MAMLGFAGQTFSTGKDPISNLADHLANPWANNVGTNTTALPFLN
jgi:light-harvesting complex I chlorophyll a/b binding protein 5